MTPEAQARQQIDKKLEQAGWVIQDMKELNLSAGSGVAVREYPTDTGPADYVLFINRTPVGVIEAKKDAAGENITVTETQTARYAAANLKWRKDSTPLRFLFEATGQIIRFTDSSDLPPPEVLQQEIIEHLEAALAAFRDVAAGLRPEVDSQARLNAYQPTALSQSESQALHDENRGDR